MKTFKNSVVLIGFLVAAIIAAAADSARAQTAAGASPEVAAGYGILSNPGADALVTRAWVVSGGYSWGHVALVAEYGRSVGRDRTSTVNGVPRELTLSSVLGGVRVEANSDRPIAFAQFLAGNFLYTDNRGESDAHLALQPGGGLDIPVVGDVALRLGVDLRFVAVESGFSLQDMRFLTGVVIRWARH